MTFVRTICFLVSSALLTVFASAQTQQLSLEDAISRSLESSKTLHISDAKVRQAQAKVDESSANKLPTLRLQGSYTRLSDVGPSQFDNPFSPGQKIVLQQAILDNYQFNLTASQVLFAGMRLDAAKDAAEFSRQASQQDVVNDKLSVRYNTTVVYWTLYKAQQLRNSVQESVKQLDARVRDAQNLLKAGMITNNELLKLQVQLSNTKVQVLDMDQQISAMMVNLNNLLGTPLTSVYELTTAPRTGASVPAAVGEDIQDAQKKRPDVLANMYRIQAADKSIDIAQGGWYPQVSATASYLYANPNARIFPSHAEFDGTWSLGVNLQWDLWNWMLPAHQAEQARAQKYQAEEGLSMLRDGIAVEATQNYVALKPAVERVSVADEAVQQANENNATTANRYKAGTATATEVIESETLLLQAKVNKINAVVDYELAIAKLNRSLGK